MKGIRWSPGLMGRNNRARGGGPGWPTEQVRRAEDRQECSRPARTLLTPLQGAFNLGHAFPALRTGLCCFGPSGLAKFIALFLAFLPSPSPAPGQETPARYKLYTKPDPQSPGGIAGRVTRPSQPIAQVLAIPFDAPEKVYEGTVEGDKRGSFRFTGLPMRKYDLLVIFENSFYEGVGLHRGESTLNDADRKKIEVIVQKSEPFFTHKIIHRVEGETGRGKQARALCTFLRTKGSELMWEQHEGKWKRDDFRRTFKLVLLKDVGPGWQIVRTRDLYPVWTRPQFVKPKHHFRDVLSGIRVADAVKDLGELDLAK